MEWGVCIYELELWLCFKIRATMAEQQHFTQQGTNEVTGPRSHPSSWFVNQFSIGPFEVGNFEI